MADYEEFLRKHELQLALSKIPKHFHRRLYEKMKNEIFDSGSYFQLCPVDDDDDELAKTFNHENRYYVSTLENTILDPDNDENAIFLIDHAWTYRIKEARSNLEQIEGLYERMAALMNIGCDTKQDGIELILQRMWKYNQTYTMTTSRVDLQRDCEEALEPFWYVMDELGSSIRHSEENENVYCTSFFFEPTQTMFTVLFPIVRIDEPFSEIFRNFLYNNNQALDRTIRLLPWQRISERKTTLRSFSIEQSPELYRNQLENDAEIYKKCHNKDLFDADWTQSDGEKIDAARVFKVFTDHDLVKQYLNDEHFQLVEQIEEADIIFVMKQIDDFRRQTLHGKMINQFPYENIVTNKELLSIVARRWKSNFKQGSNVFNDPYVESHGSPPWLATTFNLTYELTQFSAYYQYREDQQLDNIWIIKPINLTRSIDMSITNCFDMIVRLPESGPKLACKYVSKPVLLKMNEIPGDGMKFDVRYVLLLRSLRPLKLYVHKIFWLRFANKQFSLNELDDYETHFTVMNYRPNAFLRQMNCQTFISLFNEQFPESCWSTIEEKIFRMFREAFGCATIDNPPFGIASCPASRALYAADLMLDYESGSIEPKLLEINFTPDCHRACTFYPNFYNQVFNVLFRDLDQGQDVIDISK